DDDPGFFHGGQAYTCREYVVVALFYAVEDAGVDGHQRPEGAAAAGVDEAEERARVVVIGAGALGLEAHQAEIGFVLIAVAEVFFRDGEAVKVFLREVDTAVIGVFTDVAEDVGELERNAAFFG